MKKFVLLTAVAVLSACSQEQAADTSATENEVVAEADANMAAPAAPSTMETLAGTSWEFTRDGKQYFESIDESGNYIANNADGSHADHGTYVKKDGKACFTSAMDKEGEVCWTDPMLAEGQSGETTSDKGEKLMVKRIAYTEVPDAVKP